ncbi:MAG: NAD-dependent epimerase/dehydratase family protein [Candidatus Omnitrophica bacterium]|nr:NAD-dependent epimerase/dehydratase family protein [Candidatus Omnitrophota bacterium]
MSQFLVTGGAGFIGSNITEYLLARGHYVRVLDNFISGKESNLAFTSGLGPDKFELIRGDIRDKDVCDQSCMGIDYVLHQAALRSVPKSLEEPESYNDVNINGVMVMLQAAAKHKVKRFVLASSSAVYGDSDQFPLKESQYPLLMSPYALSKLAGEYYCRIYAQHFGVSSVCLRYFNVFGPKQALDDEYAVVIPKFIHSITHDQQPPVFGDGYQSRDFTFVENVVSANFLAATTPGIHHEVVNAAVGEETTVLSVVELVNKILGKNIEPQFLDKRAGDIYRTQSDITLIKEKLNYKPLVNFEEGLKRTVAYFQDKF